LADTSNRGKRASYIDRRGALATLSVSLALAALLALAIVLGVGSAGIPVNVTLRTLLSALLGRDTPDASAAVIILQIRLPRALTAYLVGAALAMSGAAMQGLFQNAMADPHIMGVSSGAALGATICMVAGAGVISAGALGLSAIAISAFSGGLIAVLLVISLARTRGRLGTMSLLLSGVAVSSTLSAILSGLMIMNRDKMEHVLLWTLGSFSASSYAKLIVLLPVVAVCFVGLRLIARDLNLMMLGSEEAASLGVRVKLVRLLAIVFSTLATAAAVSVCGIIGFVGLMVPHAVRLIVGPDHRGVLPISFLAGGLYLMIMDTLARTLAAPQELPVGVLTALVGGPFFLWLLRRRGQGVGA